MTDIVPILRDCAQSLKANGGWKNTARYMTEAADEICTLRSAMAHVVEKTGTAAADTSGANPDRDATKSEPLIKTVERILDEHSAWISRPSSDVTRAIALAASVVAFDALDERIEFTTNELQRERDAFRRCVGDIEYYFRRWSGVLSEERDWLVLRINQANAEAEGRKP